MLSLVGHFKRQARTWQRGFFVVFKLERGLPPLAPCPLRGESLKGIRPTSERSELRHPGTVRVGNDSSCMPAAELEKQARRHLREVHSSQYTVFVLCTG